MVIKMDEKQIIVKLYQNVDMGVVGIESIEDKIETRALAKTRISKFKTRTVKLL